ncbi:MAG: zinc metallopeptidase [SAR324 cluster bacterium]|nr:zinc metallopeptidase [SAR324 cluster bacterium]
MHFLLPILFILIVLYAPSFWAKAVLSRYSAHRDDIPGTGGELAFHLLKQFDMEGIKVEETALGDHYDPLAKTVRLSPGNMHGKSLTAVATAAHEVGHAIQDQIGYRPLAWRTGLVQVSQKLEKVGSLLVLATPVLTLLSRAPGAGLLTLLSGICILGGPILVHLITLPVEINASFDKAMPILKDGQYVEEQDQKSIQRILTACSLTYVANSLASLLNLWRWVAVLRR